MKNDTPSYVWTETERLNALAKYQILDTPPEKAFDDVVKLVSELLDAPIAAVNLIDKGRQWFKSEIGLGVREMPLDDSICKMAIFEEDRMIVPDTLQDPRFNCNPLVTGAPGLRFYAGELLKTPEGLPLGTLCVLDLKPRPEGLTPQQQFALETLAQQIMAQMELRKLVAEQQALLFEQQRTAEELRIERDRSYQLFQGMDEGFVFLDYDYHIRQISPGGLKMDGRRAEQIIGLTHWEAWPGSEQLPVAEAIRRAMTQRVAVNAEQLYVFPDGRKFWLDMRAYPSEGGIAMFYRNITERKEAERRLRETAQRLEFTLDAAQIGDWDLDLINDTSYRSLRHDRCFGYTEPISDWGFEAFIQHVHPDDRDGVAKQFKAAMSELKDWHFECRVVWPDKTVHWIAVHGSVYLVDNKPIRMSGIVYDITDRKNTEKALRESQAHLRSLLEQTAVGICETDLNGRIVHVNGGFCAIVGRAPEELLALRMQDITHADDLPRNIPLFKKTIATGEPFEIEKRYVKPDGSIVWVSNTVSLIRTEGDEPIESILAVSVDVTERKDAEDALKQADRRKDEFLAMLAHELRNPLAPIGAAAELLSLAHLEPQRVKQTSQVVLRQVRHMKGLIDDLLDVSRVTRGLVTLEKSDVDIKRVIASAVEQVSPLIEAKHHHLITDLAPGTAHVLGDQKRLVQVLANLLNNSAKYTNEGGHITLKMEVHDHQVLLHVKDDGSGIAPDLQPHVFELFSQASRSADRSQGGLGLGLALVRSLVELHGGRVACSSEGVGKGSCFTVTLPRRLEHEAIHADSADLNSIETAEHRLRILVVDDNVDAAQMLALLLETTGHDVLVEHTSANALETARDQTPDVCILDIGLPDIDGYKLAQRLRAHPETASCCLIAITGYGQEQDRKSALAAGFDHHLAKPVDIIDLSGVLPKGPQRERSKAVISGAF